MKKILIIGGTGTIGKEIVNALKTGNEIIVAGQKHGDIQVDITQKESIEKMYQTVGKIDAVVSAVGKVRFAALEKMNEDLYRFGLNDKLMGQVNLVLLGLSHLNDGGSFTLTSGVLNREPIVTGSSAAMVNGALDAFVKAAAIEMPRSLRINIVSPTVITEALDKYAAYFPGVESVSAARAAQAYVRSVLGAQTGQVYCVG